MRMETCFASARPYDDVEMLARIACPACGGACEVPAPDHACTFFHVCECADCGAIIRPNEGDCCVICSHGEEPCRPRADAGSASRA